LRRWSHGVPVWERGPGESYRPEDVPPSAYAPHQPGIATPLLDHLRFLALDVEAGSASELRELLRQLTEEAERLMTAERTSAGARPAGRLTVTLGLGASLFDGRFGLAERSPAALAPIPSFRGDALEPESCHGDLCVQICAAEAAGAATAAAGILAASGDRAQLRWSQQASMRRLPEEPATAPPRNLLGFKEGIGNPRREKEMDRLVWVRGDEQRWMLGGTFLVVRRIDVRLDAWSSLPLEERERVIGRRRRSGALLGRQHEFEPLAPDDEHVPPEAHVRAASRHSNLGARLLRRGYSYSDTGEDGRREGGMLLLFYQRDPRRQFIPIQTRLAEEDALTPLTETRGSAVFAVPPGAAEGSYVGAPLLEP